MNEKLYAITFVNERSVPVDVEEGGRKLVTVKPGESLTIEAWDPGTLYSRFSRVLYRRDGSVETKPNPDWVSPIPPDRWTLDLINDDSIMHSIRINGEPVEAYPGIVRTVEVDIWDDLVFRKAIRWVQDEVTTTHPRNPNYIIRNRQIVIKKLRRSKRDLSRIKEERANLQKAQVEKAIASELPPDVSAALATGDDDAAM